MHSNELRQRLEAEGAVALDLRFTDLVGSWRHMTVEASALAEGGLERFDLIDGSALLGWQDLVESDLRLLPQANRTWLDPFAAQPTLITVADVADPATAEGFERCPRSALRRTVEELAAREIADETRLWAEVGFYVFDAVEVTTEEMTLGYRLTSGGGVPPAARVTGYLASQPADSLADLRAEMISTLASLGVVGLSHMALRGPGQCELKLGPADAVTLADQLQLVRYVVEGVARAYGKVACFLPQPAAGLPGSGLHLHVALQRDGRPLFAGQGYADLSDACFHAIGGILHHTRALNAFANPSTNSYRRLRAGRREPSLLGYGARNRSTSIRIPSAARSDEKRVELRFPDPLANPYLAIAGLMMAMADGVAQKTDPGEPIDRNAYDLIDDGGALERCAADLPDALHALEKAKHELFQGQAIPDELIDAYIGLKLVELERIVSHPHPLEHAIYAG
ncbi:MAG: glutamine synthetase beta-grasp domain-containing protein [Pseudomonadota bacterium]